MNESFIWIKLALNSTNRPVTVDVSNCTLVKTNGLIFTVHTVQTSLSQSIVAIRMEHCHMTEDSFGAGVFANHTSNVSMAISNCNFTHSANDTSSVWIKNNGSVINASIQDSNFLDLFATVNIVANQKANIISLVIARCSFVDPPIFDSVWILAVESTIHAGRQYIYRRTEY